MSFLYLSSLVSDLMWTDECWPAAADAPRWVRPSESSLRLRRDRKKQERWTDTCQGKRDDSRTEGPPPGGHRQDDGTTAVVFKRKKTSQNVSNAASLETFRTPRRPDENSTETDPGSVGSSLQVLPSHFSRM